MESLQDSIASTMALTQDSALTELIYFSNVSSIMVLPPSLFCFHLSLSHSFNVKHNAADNSSLTISSGEIFYLELLR